MVLDEEGAGRMAQIMRHRLLNIVSGVKSANSLLCTMLDDRLEPQEREYFPLIDKECDKVSALVDRLNLFLGDLPPARPVGLALAVVSAEKHLRTAFPAAEIRLETDLADPEFVVCVETLKTVLHEAVDNAYGIERKPVSVLVAQTQEACMVRVVNPGKALPANVQTLAFEPFFTGRTKHLGLGLSIARRFIERAGGTALLCSGPDGNVVKFMMPALGGKVVAHG